MQCIDGTSPFQNELAAGPNNELKLFSSWLSSESRFSSPLPHDVFLTLQLEKHLKTFQSLRRDSNPKKLVKYRIDLHYDSPLELDNYSKMTHANGLCGYLAYCQYYQSCKNNSYYKCPDLLDPDQLAAFRSFYDTINVSDFDEHFPDIRTKHLSFRDNIDRWADNTNDIPYKLHNVIFRKENWCSIDLLREYDKQFDGRFGNSTPLIVAVAYDTTTDSSYANVLHIQSFYKGFAFPSDFRLTRDEFCLLSRPQFMIVLRSDHFFLMPNPMYNCNLERIFDDAVCTLKAKIKYYDEITSPEKYLLAKNVPKV